MGLQLILVIETNRKNKSDLIYVKDTIDWFYRYDRTQVKFTPVYMNGKGNYKNKEKEISSYISQYAAASKANRSAVIYFFDCDDYDTRREDADFLINARQYCDEKEYEFIWFCKDIEQVYLGNRVSAKQKKLAATEFKAKKSIHNIEMNRLLADTYREKASNVVLILDKYLLRKQS